MNIYRHKHYDFDKDIMLLGEQWKEPQVFALSPPDDDYELFIDQDYMDEFVAEKYMLNEDEGRKYKNLISAKLSNMVTLGSITLEIANSYGDATETTRHYLSEGYWHSAYYTHDAHTPPVELNDIHEEIKQHIKDYVNNKYPPVFHI